jgi:hypothetical protein
VITPKTRASVCWFSLCQVAAAFVDLYSGKRIVKNLGSDVDSKVKQYQDKFSSLRAALQEQADIYTEITVLRVLDAIDKIGECSDLGPFTG